MDQLAQVAVDVAAEGTDKLFTYRIPPALADRLSPGTWVHVPFGPRTLVGLYIGPAAAPPAPDLKLREILRTLANLPPVPPQLVELAHWIAHRYLCTFVSALRLLLPAEARRQQVRALTMDHVRLSLAPAEVAPAAATVQARAPRQAAALRTLAAMGGHAPVRNLARTVGDGVRDALKSLQKRGWVEFYTAAQRRDPFGGEAPRLEAPPALTALQEGALAVIDKTMRLSGSGLVAETVLLHGVTGSGKTEVYLRAIARCLELGRQAIVLVPEIALTPQTVGRFRSRFGQRVAVLHSALGAGEKFDEWVRIRQGEVDIVVGARSAIFAPFERLGLVVIDEEHESSYKQDENPRYHAREVAAQRCRLAGATLVLGSATPALETYWQAQSGQIGLAELPARIEDRPLPAVELVDLREELRAGNKSIFSRALQQALEETLQKREQAVLFLNRRGFSTFVSCRACGESVGCPHCAVALTYHLGGSRLTCHWCDHAQPVPRQCPNCGSTAIKYFGAGTEKVEQELKARFPTARALRMDVDTTRTKGAHATILDAFGRGAADVLIGTQMIAKGHDFPRVTLVGVVSADTSLNLPDFRAAERTFQLVTQVAGRAGRAHLLGRVIVQSYTPEHFALGAAAHHDYRDFYDQEIRWRQERNYPPYAHFVHLVVSGEDEEQVAAAGLAIQQLLVAGGLGAGEGQELLGPSPAPLAKLRGHHRHHLVLKGPSAEVLGLVVRHAFAADAGRWRKGRNVRLAIDVDPVAML